MNKLAIVVPYYKIDFFEETLKSITKQTDKNFTLYIGNDASPNDPSNLINKYFNEDDYHYFDYKDNLGGKNLALQWERILENVTEEWFQILGDDDMIADNFVEEFYKNIHLAENVIRVNRKAFDESNKLIREDRIESDKIPSVDLFIMGLLEKTVTSLSEFIFRTNQYKKYKFEKISLAWGSDVLAFMQFSDFKDILNLNSTEVYVKVTSKSITGNKTQAIEVKKHLAFNHFRKILLEKHSKYLPSNIIEMLMREYLNTCINYRKYPNIKLYKVYLKNGDFKRYLKKNYRRLLVIKNILINE